MVGFSQAKVPPSFGPDIKAMQDEWYRSRGHESFREVNAALSSALWEQAKAQVEADRQRHPKARRNAPVKPQPEIVVEGHHPWKEDR